MVSLNLGPAQGPWIGARRRRPDVRAKTVSLRKLNRERRGLPILQGDDGVGDGGAGGNNDDDNDDNDELALPASRNECRGGMRPCPFVSCRFHLYLDVNPQTGSIKLNFPDKEPWELECSCSLDVAEAGGLTLEDVGALLNLTRERARQLESAALRKVHDVLER